MVEPITVVGIFLAIKASIVGAGYKMHKDRKKKKETLKNTNDKSQKTNKSQLPNDKNMKP